MLRIVVLLATHLSFGGICAVIFAPLARRGRARSLDARAAALDTHEFFLNAKADQSRRGAFIETTPKPARIAPTPGPNSAGRHRRADPPALARAGLAEAEALLGIARAKHEQTKREFVALMTQYAKPFARATAPVLVPA